MNSKGSIRRNRSSAGITTTLKTKAIGIDAKISGFRVPIIQK